MDSRSLTADAADRKDKEQIVAVDAPGSACGTSEKATLAACQAELYVC